MIIISICLCLHSCFKLLSTSWNLQYVMRESVRLCDLNKLVDRAARLNKRQHSPYIIKCSTMGRVQNMNNGIRKYMAEMKMFPTLQKAVDKSMDMPPCPSNKPAILSNVTGSVRLPFRPLHVCHTYSGFHSISGAGNTSQAPRCWAVNTGLTTWHQAPRPPSWTTCATTSSDTDPQN